MESTLDEIEFLALSQSRVDVLRYPVERLHSRRELVKRTGASQPTVGRILSDFEDRSWLVYEDGAYRATVTGEFISRGFDNLVDILDTDAKLRPAVEWLPTDTITFDLEHLTEAMITTPNQIQPDAPVKHVVSLLSETEGVHVFSCAFNEQNLDIVRKRTAANGRRFEGAFSSDTIDALIHDSRLREQLRDLLDTDATAVHITDGPILMAAAIADSTAHLLLRDDNGILQASTDVTEPEVLTWADKLFERYWKAAEPLDLNRL